NSIRASDKLCCACTTRTLNIDTGSNGGLPPFTPSLYPSPFTSRGRKRSKSTASASTSSGSPSRLSRSKCSDSENRLDGRISEYLLADAESHQHRKCEGLLRVSSSGLARSRSGVPGDRCYSLEKSFGSVRTSRPADTPRPVLPGYRSLRCSRS